MLLIVNFLARQYLLNIWDEGDWVYSSGAPNTTAGPSLIACLVSDCDILFCGSCILKSDYDIPFCPPSEPLSDNPEQGSAHTGAWNATKFIFSDIPAFHLGLRLSQKRNYDL